jgi:hypothetical protein
LLSEISISDLVETKGFEASLITTFNASLPFYEEILLRRLRANGCRHNVVLMDSAQCSAAWETEITRPRHAGYEYSLIPIRSTGAFHPKVSIFAGPKKLALLVGSHNLTVAGLGFNREISNLLEIQEKKHQFGPVLAEAWSSLASWLESARSYCPPDLIAAGLRLQDHIKPFLNRAEQSTAVRFVAQSEHSASLLEQVKQHVTFPVRRVLVAGAFFDQQLGFLKSLRQWLPTADIVVGIDPETVVLPSLGKGLNVRFVDARAAWPDDANKYLHAKALYLEGTGERSVFLSGSANPSGPGWGTPGAGRNAEAMILIEGTAAKQAVEETGLKLFFGFEQIASAELAKTVARAARITTAEPGAALTILIGTVDYEAKTIAVELSSGQQIVRVQALDEWNEGIEVTPSIDCAERLVSIGIPEYLPAVRSLLLFGEEGPFARVLVHHTSVLAANSASSRQQVIRAALGEIGNTGTDVATLIEQVQQVIFAAEASEHVGFKTSSGAGKATSDANRPDTLAVDDAEFNRHKRKRRLIESGDLGYLIDTLIRLLHMPSVSSPSHSPEPVSADDEEDNDNPGDPVENSAFDDAEIAAAISRKSRSLIRKMIEREKHAADETGSAATMLVQLVAVLAVLKELRYLERQGRWRNSSLQLVDSAALESLFQKSMYYLFSSSHRLWAAVEGEGGARFEELDTLNLLLTWLAWEVGYTFTLSVPNSWEVEREDHDWLLAGNGYLGKLLPRVGVENQWNLLETSILRTIHPIPAEKKDADTWLEINMACGDALLEEFTDTTERPEKNFSVGGFAFVPRRIDPWSVVLDFDDTKVAIWDFEIEAGGSLGRRSFLRSAVVPAIGISN